MRGAIDRDEQTLTPQDASSRAMATQMAEILRALEQQAWRNFLKHRFADALTLADRLGALSPERPWPHYLRGEICNAQRQFGEAQRHYMAAIALGMRDHETLLRAGESAWKAQRHEEAARFMAAAAAHPDMPAARSLGIRDFLSKLPAQQAR